MAKLTRQPSAQEIEYITHVEQWWHEHKRFPAPIISAEILKVSRKEIETLGTSSVVKTMLDNRGIPLTTTPASELSPEQLAAANTYLNLADPRPLNTKLKELGISVIRFNGWMKGRTFGKYIRERAEDLLDEGMPFAHRELMNKVMHGNMDAIKFYYQVTGRYTGAPSIDAQNIGLTVQRLLEAIQIEVSDPELIQRIAGRFQTITTGEPITPQPNTPMPAPQPHQQTSPQHVLMQRVIKNASNDESAPDRGPVGVVKSKFHSEDDHGITF